MKGSFVDTTFWAIFVLLKCVNIYFNMRCFIALLCVAAVSFLVGLLLLHKRTALWAYNHHFQERLCETNSRESGHDAFV